MVGDKRALSHQVEISSDHLLMEPAAQFDGFVFDLLPPSKNGASAFG